jgi:hypothetical protein
MTTPLVMLVKSGIVISLCLLVLLSLRQHYRIPNRIFALVLVAFSSRSMAGIVVEHAGTAFGQVDFYKFDQALWQTAQAFHNGIITEPFTIAAQHGGDLFYIPYTILYAPVYTIFGHETLLARFVFALVGTLFVFNVYRLGIAVHGQTVGSYAAAFSAIFPYWLYLSAIFYRDMLIMLVLSQLLLVVIRLADRKQPVFNAVSAGFLSVLSVVLRPENIVPVAVTVSIGCYYYLRARQPRLGKAVGGGLLTTTILGGNVLNVIKISNVTDRLNFLVEGVSSGSGAYLTTVFFPNLTSVISFVPIGTTYFLLVPFPWQIHNMLAGLAFVQNAVFWYPTVVLTLLGVPYLLSRRPVAAVVLLGFLISGIVPYGIVERNMGPALRHRSQFQIVFVLFASIAVTEKMRLEFQTSSVENLIQNPVDD